MRRAVMTGAAGVAAGDWEAMADAVGAAVAATARSTVGERMEASYGEYCMATTETGTGRPVTQRRALAWLLWRRLEKGFSLEEADAQWTALDRQLRGDSAMGPAPRPILDGMCKAFPAAGYLKTTPLARHHLLELASWVDEHGAGSEHCDARQEGLLLGVILGFQVGLRAGEIVDLREGEVRLVEVEGVAGVQVTKTLDKSSKKALADRTCTVALDPDLGLAARLAAWGARRAAAAGGEEKLLFPLLAQGRRAERAYTVNGWTNAVKALMKAAGVDAVFGARSCRYGRAVRLLQDGASVEAVRLSVGWTAGSNMPSVYGSAAMAAAGGLEAARRPAAHRARKTK